VFGVYAVEVAAPGCGAGLSLSLVLDATSESTAGIVLAGVKK
jgi:hypothetical protein